MTELVRKFETGATRSSDTGKFDYEGFLSPLVLLRFGEYMHKHRLQPDGSLRASDNWQKGIPLDQYIKSQLRHNMDLWLHHRGHSDLTTEDLEDTLCALMFNTMGYLHETLKAKKNGGLPSVKNVLPTLPSTPGVSYAPDVLLIENTQDTGK